eukprot:TRINITY_DN84474_c0_g1_i1.p1 TRINITY_DN84474_c0_g1~~TRINITY_DN84474_c0_g1_i1.p1  ORF type:complete len:126 (-),score=12.83 TRINITY_DN84474_c0_g1_i1:200-577(-)
MSRLLLCVLVSLLCFMVDVESKCFDHGAPATAGKTKAEIEALAESCANDSEKCSGCYKCNEGDVDCQGTCDPPLSSNKDCATFIADNTAQCNVKVVCTPTNAAVFAGVNLTLVGLVMLLTTLAMW